MTSPIGSSPQAIIRRLLAPITARLQAWQPPETWPPWAQRAVGLGPIAGALLGGALLYFPSHSIGQGMTTGVLMFAVIGGLRAADPHLGPFWEQLRKVPANIRRIAGFGLPILYSMNQFGPGAAGNEVGTAQTTLLVSSVLAFVLLHPDDEPEQ